MKKITVKGFTDGGNWYKGNLHSHTVNSDGMLTPEESVELLENTDIIFCVFQSMTCIQTTEISLTVRNSLSFRDLRLPLYSIWMTDPGGEGRSTISMEY